MNTQSNTLRQRVDTLWDDVEARAGPDVSRDHNRLLRGLDGKACDGTLTEADLEKASSQLKQPQLFGDYELIIDECLNGDPEVKLRVAAADRQRRGLATLKYHLTRNGAKPKGLAALALRSCEMDQEYYEQFSSDAEGMRGIDVKREKYRVRITVNGCRLSQSFSSLIDAKKWRDLQLSRDEGFD
jgi:hypothetical protein